MKNLTQDLNKAMEIFNINVTPVVAEDVLSAEDKAMTQEVIANCDAIEEAMAVKNLINNFWTIVAEDSKQALEQWNNVFDKEEEPVEDNEIVIDPDDFIADVDSLKEEAETLHTEELLRIQQEYQLECDRCIAIVDSILNNEDIVSKYGNKTIKKHREIAPKLNMIPTGCDKSLIELTMDGYGCTYNQATSKLCKALNINYNHKTWFKMCDESLNNNRKIINNHLMIVAKYPKLARYNKYAEHFLNLMQTQLEHNGLSYRGGKKPLLASASVGFIQKTMSTKTSYSTVYKNMNNLAFMGAIKKLTDEEVKAIDPERYEQIMSLKRSEDEATITTYEFVEWTDEVLKAMNDMLTEKQRTRATNRSQCYMMFDAIGHGDVISKSKKIVTDDDKIIIADLKKWGCDKIRWSGFITMADIDARFNTIKKEHGIIVRKDRRNKYITKALTAIGLSYEFVSQELKSLVNSKKFYAVNYKEVKKVWVRADLANKLHKYNN